MIVPTSQFPDHGAVALGRLQLDSFTASGCRGPCLTHETLQSAQRRFNSAAASGRCRSPTVGEAAPGQKKKGWRVLYPAWLRKTASRHDAATCGRGSTSTRRSLSTPSLPVCPEAGGLAKRRVEKGAAAARSYSAAIARRLKRRRRPGAAHIDCAEGDIACDEFVHPGTPLDVSARAGYRSDAEMRQLTKSGPISRPRAPKPRIAAELHELVGDVRRRRSISGR